MAFRFHRRPFLLGNTDTAVESLPFIRGTVRRDPSTLAFAALVFPARLNITITDNSLTPVNYIVDFPSGSTLINDVVADIHAEINVDNHRCFDMGGVVHIEAANGGEGAYIEVTAEPALTDAAVVLGIPRMPDPMAHVDGGDRSWAPYNIVEQNPHGTSYAVGGEDVTAQVMNRAVDALAYNADHMHALLEREIALPMIIDLTAGDARLITDASGDYEQVDLTGLEAAYPTAGYSDRVYMGQALSNTSTLTDIAEYFAVMDQDAVEIISGGDTVRVAAVTHGLRTAPLPDFGGDETIPPANPVGNSVNPWVPSDGGNLLGQDVVKSSATVITGVEYRTAVRCATGNFVAEGVGPRDKVMIANAAVNIPFNHNGEFTVEQLIDETFLILQGLTEQRGELNPDDSAALGDVTVSTGSVFADGVYLTFEPPIPAGTNVRLVVGGGYKLGDMPMDQFLKLAIIASEEVDDLVQQTIRRMKGPLVDLTDDFTAYPFTNGGYAGEADVSQELIWRRLTLQGAYDGQGRSSGGGYFVQVDANPPEWNNMTALAPVAGTEDDTATGATVLAGNQFYIAGHDFELNDVGNQIRVTAVVAGTIRLGATFVIIDYLDEENVIVEPGEYNPTVPITGDYTVQILSGKKDGMAAAMSTHVLDSALYGRLGYFHEEDRVADRQFGHHFVGVRETDQYPHGETLSLTAVTFGSADEWVTLGFDPTEQPNLRAAVTGDTDETWSPSIARITDTWKNDGWYVVLEFDGTGRRMRLQNFDGTYPVFDMAYPGNVHMYLPTQSYLDVRPSGAEAHRVANIFFEDATAWATAVPAGTNTHHGVLGVDWRGASSGLVALINGPNWQAYKTGNGAATGSAVNVSTYMPANGVESRHYGAPYNTNLLPGGSGAQADALERGGMAGAFLGTTFSMDGQPGPAPYMKGSALYAAQKGSDPALVVAGWEQGGSHGATPGTDDLTFVEGKATLVASRMDDYSMMQSGAGEFLGALYQWDPKVFWATEGGGAGLHAMYGGIYTELALGSRHSNSPISVAKGKRFYEVAADGGSHRSRLGQPGQVHSTDIEVDLYPVDPTRSRSHKSSGFVQWYGTAVADRLIAEDPSTYIGQQLGLVGHGGLGGAYDDIYTIINVDVQGADETLVYWFEVYLEGTTLPTDMGENKITLLGSRWHFGNVDIEAYSLIGSNLVAATTRTISGLGALGAASLRINRLDDIGGPLQFLPAAVSDYSNGLGRTNSEMTTSFALNALAAGRHPIANEAWHHMREPMGSPSGVPSGSPPGNTDFSLGDIVLRTSGLTDYYIETAFDEQFDSEDAGAIHFQWNLLTDGNHDPEDLYVYVRTGHVCLTEHYNFTVTLRVKQPDTPGAAGKATKNVKIGFVQQIGGTLISLEKSVTLNYIGGEESSTKINFNSEEMAFDLRNGLKEALEVHGEAILRIAVGDTATGSTSTLEDFYLFQAAVVNNQQSVHSGDLVNLGQVAANGFALVTQAMDYKSYGPASSKPFGSAGYGDSMPWPKDINTDLGPADGLVEPTAFLIGDGKYLHPSTPEDDGWITALEGTLNITPASWYYHYGRHAATFLFVDDRYYPKADLTAARYIPSKVGHIIPLDPPHGSRLASLKVGVSVRPSVGGGWRIWNSTGCGVSDYMVPGTEGYTLQLIRYSVLPTELRAPRELGTDLVTDWDQGFAEVLAEVDVDLVGAPGTPHGMAQSFYSCGETGPDDSASTSSEGEFLFTDDVPLDAIEEKLLNVDRRQFTYALIVSCWGRGNESVLFSLNEAAGGGSPYSAGISITGGPEEELEDNITKFSFRGAVLGCSYSRINP